MKKYAKLFLIVVAVMLLATPVFAQATGGDSGKAPISNWELSGIGLGIAVAGAGLGQAKVAAAACEGIARNPGAKPGIQTAMIFGLAFIESLVLFIWVMLFLVAFGILKNAL